MPNINVEAIAWTEFVSSNGAFRGRYRTISLAFGAKKDAGAAVAAILSVGTAATMIGYAR